MASLIEKDSLIVSDFKSSFWMDDYVDSKIDRQIFETIYPLSGIGPETDSFSFILPK